MQYERNLVLVHTPHLQARTDYETVQAKLAVAAPDIEVFIVNNNARQSVTRRAASGRPTLLFSPVALKQFQPVRGKLYVGHTHHKVREMQRLAEGGIRVPEGVVITPETRLDPAIWGAFTVLKPSEGMQGAGIRLVRTRDVGWVDPRSWPRGDPRHGVPIIAQRFIDTGEFATSYRVLTAFGRVVYSARSRSATARPVDLAALRDDEPLDIPIASNAGERTFAFNFEKDVIAYGCEAARAFPEIPILGVDLVRDQATGTLYVLEVNAGGYTWVISSNYGAVLQRKHNINIEAQFGALQILSDALIDVTRHEAE